MKQRVTGGEDAILPSRFHAMRWLSNVRLADARRCRHGEERRFRIGIDGDGRITAVRARPQAALPPARTGAATG